MSSVIALLQEEKCDLHISASALKCLDSCPRQCWYRYVEGVRSQDIAARMVLGTAMHKALAEMCRSHFSVCRSAMTELTPPSRPAGYRCLGSCGR